MDFSLLSVDRSSVPDAWFDPGTANQRPSSSRMDDGTNEASSKVVIIWTID
jgi:hypothetical protein